MNRFRLGKIVRHILHWHYRVRCINKACLYDGKTHLVMPNHPAYIDPILLFAECAEIPLRPFSDARFFRNRFYRWALSLANAVQVPDLEKSHEREADAARIRQLAPTAINALKQGQDIVFYPSGHVKLIDREVIGNRRLAYEVCAALPDNVEVVLVRTRGLEGSHWSKLPKKTHCLRRDVTMTFEVMTSQVRQWAATCDRREFNQHLEEWYNNNTIVLDNTSEK